MKREMRKWLKWSSSRGNEAATMALATDAEVKRLRGELRNIDRMIRVHRSGQMPTPPATVIVYVRNMLSTALKPTRRTRRKS